MDATEIEYHKGHTLEAFPDDILSADSPGAADAYEEQAAAPRVGDQYQVEIPSLLTESERLQLRLSPIFTDNKLGIDGCFGVGLAIPITWVHHSQEEFSTHIVADEAGSLKSRNYEEPQSNTMNGDAPKSSNHYNILPQRSACKIETSHGVPGQRKEFAGSTRQKRENIDDQMNRTLGWLKARKARGYKPFPGLSTISWSEAEEQSFLLGLYIFGKNLVRVKNFMDCREMGDVLSYYYGMFYKSAAHRRWSECRKIKTRKCIHGQRIFTGWRQQELLSRLLPTASKERQDTLLEAVKKFNESRASLEEFIFSLKAAVGMQVLVEAVGIGKGKHDLTGISLDPVRNKEAISGRSEVPVGKACSSLTSSEIIKFLTGDFRLSKARSNDLFWEAVWPRLLARGWHSEQPKDANYAGSKNVLVFLIPGIKKFSRRRLVKGNHYFDSVSDVLNKVASDPKLLELETEGSNEWEVDTKRDQNGLSKKQQRHCYLQPKLPKSNLGFMKFTVVDTSSVQGEGPHKVRELRSLPIDATSSHTHSTNSGETGSSSSDQSNTDGGEQPRVLFEENKLEKTPGILSGQSSSVMVTKISPINGHVLDDECIDTLKDKVLAKEITCQFSRRVKSSESDCLVPDSKRRRLNACDYNEAGHFACSSSNDLEMKESEISFQLEPIKEIDVENVEIGLSRGKKASNSSAKSSGNERDEHRVCPENTVGEAVCTLNRPIPRTLIDLNHSPPDYEAGESFQEESTPEEPLHTLTIKHQQNGYQATETTSNSFPSRQQLSFGNRRQSTRNRPLTTKALEALESGFLDMKANMRGAKAMPSNRRARRAKKAIEVPGVVTTLGTMSSNTMDTDGEWYSTSLVQSERKGTHEFLGIP